MIEPNLAIGAIFEDGGLYYKVQSILPNGNYVSKRVDKPSTKEVVKGTEQSTSAGKNTRGRKKA